jgi:hypothetical protein
MQLNKINMKEMENKFLNFDGMTSEVANDMPWSDTVWSNAKGGDGQYPEITPARRGEETITLDHHTNSRPNMVLSDDDNSKMPDSDVWSNHPGFLGITWSKKKAERQREEGEQAKVNANYPNSGSCAVLTDSLERLQGDIEKLEANKDGGGKGAKRVNARARKTRKIRKSSVSSSQVASCEGEEAAFQREAQTTQQLVLQGGTTSSSAPISPLNIGLGVLVLGGIVFGIIQMTKK